MIKSMSELSKTILLFSIGVILLFSPAVRSCLSPFLSALLLADWANAPVSRLAQKLPRWLAALVILSLAGLLVCNLALVLGVQLWQAIPKTEEFLRPGESLLPALSRLADRLPGPLGIGGRWIVTQLQSQTGLLHTRLEEKTAQLAQRAATALPHILIRWGITLLASFYACADWERVRQWFPSLFPEGLRQRLSRGVHRLKLGLLGWLRVQGRLFLVQLCILWAGLLFLRVGKPLFFALLAACSDALPVLGSGIVLVPWAAARLMQGDWYTAAGLGILWAMLSLCRCILEPRFLGRQTGRSPLLSLLVLYAGLRLGGVAGLILAPVTFNALTYRVETEDSPA